MDFSIFHFLANHEFFNIPAIHRCFSLARSIPCSHKSMVLEHLDPTGEGIILEENNAMKVAFCDYCCNELIRISFWRKPVEDVQRLNISSDDLIGYLIIKHDISKIAKKLPINYFYIEEIGVNTSIKLKESLDNGSVAFIAGDRIGENLNAKTFEAELFGHKVDFPVGSFKIAQLMEVPVYFVIALKTKGDTYTIHLQKHNFTSLEDMEQSYVKFLERITLKTPLQFYHFYDLFKD